MSEEFYNFIFRVGAEGGSARIGGAIVVIKDINVFKEDFDSFAMLDFHVIEDFSPQQQQQIASQVKDEGGLKRDVKIFGYYACNNGIRSGQEMGQTFNAMQADARERYGKTVQVSMLTGDWGRVPSLIAERRRQVAGRYANEPFDMIAYRQIRKRA